LDDVEKNQAMVELQIVLIRLWVLSDKINMTVMQNCAMKELLTGFRYEVIRSEAAKTGWDSSGDGSKMRYAIATSFLHHRQEGSHERRGSYSGEPGIQD
jgi:hypothetical protein